MGRDRQGSEKAVSKFMIFWKKLRGPTADALGSCGRKGCAQNREIKRGAFGYKCAQGECVSGGQAQRGRGQVPPVVATGCMQVLSVPLAIKPEQKTSKGVSLGIR